MIIINIWNMRNLILFALLCIGFPAVSNAEELDPAEIMHGERLFLETRLSQFFAAHYNGDVNTPLTKGDPALEKTVRFIDAAPYQLPFTDSSYEGQSFNCRACHLVDEHLDASELGMRSYADYASRSPLPTRDDGLITTVRNSPTLVDASLPRNSFMLHFDGEFSSLDQLVRDTLTNRNMGWVPGEKAQAVQHICKVIQQDDGNNELAEEFGGYTFKEVFSGKTADGKNVANDYMLPADLLFDVGNASCDEIFAATANLIAIYIDDLRFAQDEEFISPYDLFLTTNSLPTNPEANESHIDYSLRLMESVIALEEDEKLTFIEKNPNTEDGMFQFHDQVFEFGEKQLAGMKVFFSQSNSENTSAGNCIACHAAPHFTNFGLHNTGVTQTEYDAIHGHGSFSKLEIPSVNQRNKKADLYLPATQQHNNRQGIFRSVPTKLNPMATDLGAWNILFNTDYSLAQESVYSHLCLKDGKVVCKSRDDTLEKSIATFKTPGLRDLGHSSPYMHNGQFSDLKAIVSFYLAISVNAREGMLRNPDDEIANIQIKPQDIESLSAFLDALNEDYN